MPSALCVVAHPDDEVLLAGATLARLSDENHVYVLALGGIRREGETDGALEVQFRKAVALLSGESLPMPGFLDQRFDGAFLKDIIGEVEDAVKVTAPDLVITHFIEDLNRDHQLTALATLTALRPLTGSKHPTILMGETLSSTEWSAGSFKPNWYEDASGGLERKVEAMKVYEGEIREPPHPRSEEGIRTLARMRGMECGLEYAEAFQLIRHVRLGN